MQKFRHSANLTSTAAFTCAAALVASIGFTLSTVGAANAAPAIETSVNCPATTIELTPAQRTSLWTLAERKLNAAAQGSTARYPFGAIGERSQFIRTSAYDWTSGFFPGELWLTYQATSDPKWRSKARAWTKHLLELQQYTGSHDLGFMLGLPLELGMSADASKSATYRKAYINAAASLAKRWNANVGAIKSGEYDGTWGVIIDSAMNMPMMLKAAELTTDATLAKKLRYRALSHYHLLARDFVRSDGSTIHRNGYNSRTGKNLGPLPGQGLSASSTWARGQAWAIAGFTQGYALTNDSALLAAAVNTATYWMKHVPAGCVPAWDLAISNPNAPRDSSAAAIAAYGLELLADELDELEPAGGKAFHEYVAATLGTLATNDWTTETSANPGLLRRATYNVPADRREGSYVWGDFYLLRAISAVDESPHELLSSQQSSPR